jgi:hypothetical protein
MLVSTFSRLPGLPLATAHHRYQYRPGRAAVALLLGLLNTLALAQTCAVPGRDGTAGTSGTVNTY